MIDPILTTGDIVPQRQTPPYQMSGIPDGLGANSNAKRDDDDDDDNGNRGESGKCAGTYTVLMNHELGVTFFPGSHPS